MNWRSRVNVALFGVDGSLPGLQVDPAGDRGVDEAAQLCGVDLC
ncbi:hypothetical protein [Streptosporangium sp. KLBMP 9127]